MTTKPTGKSATGVIRIDLDGEEKVLLTGEQEDRFMLSQRQVLERCSSPALVLSHTRKVQQAFTDSIIRIVKWCKEHRSVVSCAIAPRMDDTIVIITVSDEDPGGHVHEAMSELDLTLFRKNSLRLYWLLLRASEAAGIDAFSDPSVRIEIYDAKSSGA